MSCGGAPSAGHFFLSGGLPHGTEYPQNNQSSSGTHHQALPRSARLQRHLALRGRGRSACPRRRERRRKDDADEHPDGALPPRRGTHPDQRGGSRLPLPQRRIRRRTWDGAPAVHAGGEHDGAGEHRPGLHAGVVSPEAEPRHGARPHRRGGGEVRARRRPGRLRLAAFRRRTAARGAGEDALPRRALPHPRRTDQRPHAAGDGRADPPAQTDDERTLHRLHQP